MPRFDGTGPEGKGEMTGRGRGNCDSAIQDTREEKIALERGLGRGLNRVPLRGQGLGLGRGLRRGSKMGLGRNCRNTNLDQGRRGQGRGQNSW